MPLNWFFGQTRETYILLVNRFNHQRQLVSYFWLWNGRQLSLKSIVPPTKERKKKRSPSRTVPTESSIEGAAALWHEFLHLACVWTERHNSAPLNLHTLFWNVNDGLNVLMLWPGFKEKRNEKTKQNKSLVRKNLLSFCSRDWNSKMTIGCQKTKQTCSRTEWMALYLSLSFLFMEIVWLKRLCKLKYADQWIGLHDHELAYNCNQNWIPDTNFFFFSKGGEVFLLLLHFFHS